jgi:hypothetical protein
MSVDKEKQVLMSHKVMSWLNTFFCRSLVGHYYYEDNIQKKIIVVWPLPVDLNNMYLFVYLKIVRLQIYKTKLSLCIIQHHINLRVSKELLVHIAYEAGWTEYVVLTKLWGALAKKYMAVHWVFYDQLLNAAVFYVESMPNIDRNSVMSLDIFG